MPYTSQRTKWRSRRVSYLSSASQRVREHQIIENCFAVDAFPGRPPTLLIKPSRGGVVLVNSQGKRSGTAPSCLGFKCIHEEPTDLSALHLWRHADSYQNHRGLGKVRLTYSIGMAPHQVL